MKSSNKHSNKVSTLERYAYSKRVQGESQACAMSVSLQIYSDYHILKKTVEVPSGKFSDYQTFQKKILPYMIIHEKWVTNVVSRVSASATRYLFDC